MGPAATSARAPTPTLSATPGSAGGFLAAELAPVDANETSIPLELAKGPLPVMERLNDGVGQTPADAISPVRPWLTPRLCYRVQRLPRNGGVVSAKPVSPLQGAVSIRPLARRHIPPVAAGLENMQDAGNHAPIIDPGLSR